MIEFKPKKTEAIWSGRIKPRGGAIKDQSGAKTSSGESLTDPQIASMNWRVQGIEGNLPA